MPPIPIEQRSPHGAVRNVDSLPPLRQVHEDERPHTTGPPIAYRVQDAVRASGLSRSSLYELKQRGVLRMVKVAGRTLIRHEDLAALFATADAA